MMRDDPDIAIAIMAGGRSTRMGRDKGALEIAGRTLLERTAATALDSGCCVAVIGRQPPQIWPFDDISFFCDEEPGAGPLGGLATALRHLGGAVLALACDLPLLNAGSLRWLIDAAAGRAGHHGIVTLNEGRPEPLFSIYFPSVLPLADRLLTSENRSLRTLHAVGSFAAINAPPAVARTLHNVNTPEEWADVMRSSGFEVKSQKSEGKNKRWAS